MAHRCMRTQLSPALPPSWLFSHSLCQPAANLCGADATTRAPEGSRADTREAGNGPFWSTSIRGKRSREKVAVPLRAALIPITPNPPEGRAGLSRLRHWPAPATSQVGKCNFIKALGASLSASALQQSIQREVMKNFSLWPQAQTHNIPWPTSVNKSPALPTCPQPLAHRCPCPGPPCTRPPQPSWTGNSCFVFPNSYCMGTFICKPALGGPEL